MPLFKRLPRAFYEDDTLQVARAILGKRLVHLEDGKRLSGLIVEAEAYCGEQDLGCHAKAGRTRRTEVMYGKAGTAYVYFTYGMHWMFNCVTQAEGQPEAVLIRAIVPQEGLAKIEERRASQSRKHWTDGPAKLTQALGITGKHNGTDLTGEGEILFLEEGWEIPERCVTRGPRIGLYSVPEPWKSKPWRFVVDLETAGLEEIMRQMEEGTI
jgi:DNA-3-methyladenine glycosylase